jgi:hypothetical protein
MICLLSLGSKATIASCFRGLVVIFLLETTGRDEGGLQYQTVSQLLDKTINLQDRSSLTFQSDQANRQIILGLIEGARPVCLCGGAHVL